MDARAPMTQLTSVAGAFRARVLAARLQSEGIDAQLRGSVDGPYGFTVGDMARVEVYVPEDELADARYVLLADEVDAALAAPADWGNPGTDQHAPGRPWLWWVAAALLTIVVLGPLLAAAAHL
jgi:hypothetical protein